MRIDIITLFPAMFAGVLGDSILKRAAEAGLLDIHFTNPRDFAYDKHKQVDDSPFGGGSGMVMKPEPMFRAVHQVMNVTKNLDILPRRTILLSPRGIVFNQQKAKELAAYNSLVLICGHYEGFDERIAANLADEELSIGDFVLTGGELPAMVIIDAVARMLPGVLGSAESAATDSFYDGLLEFPQYTRPREYLGLAVPEVLLSGNHAKINEWRRQESLANTLRWRPDLLAKADLTDKDREFLAKLGYEDNSIK